MAVLATGQRQEEDGPVDAYTSRWRGPIGWPFETPMEVRTIWVPQWVAEVGGFRQLPQGPLLGQGDLGMTVLTDEGQWPSGAASGNVSMMLGANQLWAISDNDWASCQWPNKDHTWIMEIPNCSYMMPRMVGLGALNISAPSFHGAGFTAEQRMREGAVTTEYRRADGAVLATRSVMSDADKVLLTDITYTGPQPVDITLELWTYPMSVNTSAAHADSIAATVHAGVDPSSGLSFFTRKTIPDSWNATAQIQAAVAMSVLASSGAKTTPIVADNTVTTRLTLAPGENVTVAVAMVSTMDLATAANGGRTPRPPWKHYQPLAPALALARRYSTPAAHAALRSESAGWWESYWSKSEILLPSEPLLSFFWHSAQYAMGSASRPGKLAPSAYGPWNTNDLPAWLGDYCMDYNVESQYYGVHSSNHAEQAESQFELIRSFLPTAATGAANLQRFFNKSCEADTGPGLTFPSHIAPWGYTASIGPTPMGDQRIRWNGELAMTVLLWDWEYSRNRTQLETLTWPFLTGLAAKWRCWLVKEDSLGALDGYLLVNYNDSWGEQNTGDPPWLINPNQPQAWMRRLFEFLPVMAEALDKPVEGWWAELLNHLPPQAVTVADDVGGNIYYGQSTNSHNDADSLYTVFPVEAAGLLGETVDPVAVLIANTSAMLGCDAVFNNSENKSVFWTPTPYAGTRGCHFWTQTARIAAAHPTPTGTPACVLRSWEPDVKGDLVDCLNVWLEMTMLNGTYRSLPFFAQGLLENAGVSQSINDMLLTSHGYGLRLFPIWAALRPTEDAAFKTLRGKGAFLVSAEYHGSSGTVGNVTILSEAGSPCRVLSPWPAAREISVREGSGGKTMAVRVSRTGWLEFETQAGAEYVVEAPGCRV